MGACYLLHITDTYRAGLLGHILFRPRDQVFHPSGRPMRLNSSAVRLQDWIVPLAHRSAARQGVCKHLQRIVCVTFESKSLGRRQ